MNDVQKVAGLSWSIQQSAGHIVSLRSMLDIAMLDESLASSSLNCKEGVNSVLL